MKPLTLLDVDGVLHDSLAMKAIRSSTTPDAMAERFDVDIVTSHGRRLAVPRYMGALVQGVATNSSVWWCTTWRDRANDELRQHLGLPVLPVCDDGTNRVGLSWKAGMVNEMLSDPANSGRSVFWIEDFDGEFPETNRPVVFIDTAPDRILRPGDLPAELRVESA